MKKILLLLLPIVSCAPKFRPDLGGVTRYYYVVLKPTDVYEKPDSSSKRLMPLSPGDTLSTSRELIQVQGWQAMERKGSFVYLRNPSILPIQPNTGQQMTGISLPVPSPGNNPAYPVSASKSPVSTRYAIPTAGAAIYKLPDGGQYYYTKKGHKVTIPRP